MIAGRIRVIGEQDAVMGLGLIGLEGQVVATLAEADGALEAALHDPEIALILLTERWAEQLQMQVIEAMLNVTGTVVVEIPSAGSASVSPLHERMERSLGTVLGA
jgi:vacuolar-type H+-ATPase subunit F/Vma7